MKLRREVLTHDEQRIERELREQVLQPKNFKPLKLPEPEPGPCPWPVVATLLWTAGTGLLAYAMWVL